MMRKIKNNLIKYKLPYFIISIILIFFSFLIVRLPIWLDYSIVSVQYDSSTYFAILKDIMNNKCPSFTLRTPGYPILLGFSFLFSPKLMSVVYFQNFLTIFSSIFFLFVIYRLYPILVIPTAIALCAHVAMPMLYLHEFAMLSDSTYTSFLLFSISLLIYIIHNPRKKWIILFSLLIAFTILIRPAGLFLIPILILICIFFTVNKYGIGNILCLISPLFIIILSLFIYNKITINKFNFTGIGDITLYAITSMYWETSSEFPDEINNLIKKFHKSTPEKSKIIIKNSWDPVKLSKPFIERACFSINISKDSVLSAQLSNSLTRSKRLTLAKAIAVNSIRKNPLLYIKWIWSMQYNFLLDKHNSWYLKFEGLIKAMYQQFYFSKYSNKLDAFVFREFVKPPHISNIQVLQDTTGSKVIVKKTFLLKLSNYFVKIIRIFFDNIFFLIAYLILLIMGFISILKSKLKNKNIFIIFIITLVHFLAGLLISMSTSLTNRYNYPTRIFQYLSLFLMPLVITEFYIFKKNIIKNIYIFFKNKFNFIKKN